MHKCIKICIDLIGLSDSLKTVMCLPFTVPVCDSCLRSLLQTETEETPGEGILRQPRLLQGKPQPHRLVPGLLQSPGHR